jgi:hypothetical protein
LTAVTGWLPLCPAEARRSVDKIPRAVQLVKRSHVSMRRLLVLLIQLA